MLNCYLRNFNAFRLIGKYHPSLSLSNVSVSKSDLSKLRKISGFSFIKCKEALVKFNDIEKAHSWLKSEAEKHGWNKMGKLADRPMSNGLIGLQLNTLSKDISCGIMVEINCETDFVARNQNFHKLIHESASAFMNNFSEDINTIKLNNEEFKRLLYIDKDSGKSETLENILAVNIGSLGENMLLKRAIGIKTNSKSYLSMYSHLSWQDINKKWKETHFGKYGVILKYGSTNSEVTETWKKNASSIARQICQHIVGLNPVKIGNEEIDKPNDVVDNEDALIYQQFLMDDNIKIKDLLQEHSMVIEDFQRFNCGEDVIIS